MIDIDSLYANIDSTLGLAAVKELFLEHPDLQRSDEEIITLLEIKMTWNDFIFSSEHFLQINGTAMGEKFAPAYANIHGTLGTHTVFKTDPSSPSLFQISGGHI